MPKEEWGVKRVCPTTGKRFYDLGRSPVVSPYTGEVVNIETGNKNRVLVKDEKDKATVVAEEAAADDDDVVDVLDTEEDPDIEVDDDLLDDEDDDSVPLHEIADVSTEDNES